MPVSEATFRQLSLEDPESQWELVCGRLREKPTMTQAHGEAAFELAVMLRQQLDPRQYRVRSNHPRTRLPNGDYYIPDIAVLPASIAGPDSARPLELDAYADPLPLVVEVWSPSTGKYDATTKIAGYQERGDHEIWLVHPYDRTIRVFQRRPDWSYTESLATEGALIPASLPGVTIALDELFREW